MKIVIIGGGIAGMSFGLIMKKKGHEVVVCERYPQIPELGNAFLVHPSGMNSLSVISGLDPTDIRFPGKPVHTFRLLSPEEEIIRSEENLKWRCMSRCELAEWIAGQMPNETIKFSRYFSHFEWEGGKATAAVFEDGSREEGDIFIGSDGGNSRVRKNIFGDTAYSAIEVLEILGISNNYDLAKTYSGCFTKYQCKDKGLSFGFIPFSENALIWFTQFDIHLQDTYHFGEGKISDFLHRMLDVFPSTVKQLIESSPADQLYIWRTRDFNPLPHFHSQNIVLLGDAAHLTLPFASAGTTNAITDAIELASSMDEYSSTDEAFKNYYDIRIKSIREHVKFGRRLKEAFLHPELHSSSPAELPFIQ